MRRLLVIWLTLFLSVPLWAQDRYSCIPFADESRFQVGESLTLGVSYKWGAVNTEVAQATLRLDETRLGRETIYHSDLSARTAPFFDVFFKIREHFEGWFKKGTLQPQKCIRDTHEGTYAAYNLYSYDWEARQIHAYVDMTSTGPMNLDIPLVDCVCDVPTLVYFIRQMDLSKMETGKRYGLNFAIDDMVFHIYLTKVGIETIKVRGMGKVRCQMLRCSVVEGAMFEGNEDVKIWLSDDANQLPISFWAPLRVGAMRGMIKSYKNLLYDFTALEKK